MSLLLFTRAQIDSVFMLHMIERHAGTFVAANVLNEIYERCVKQSDQVMGHRNRSHNIYAFPPAPDAFVSRPPERAGVLFPLQLARDARRAIQRLSRLFTVC